MNDQNQPANQYGPLHAAGINIGFRWTKIATTDSVMVWPSVVTEYRAGLQASRQIEPGMLTCIEGGRYEVGEGATQFGTPLKALHRDFFKTDVYAALVQASMQRLAMRGKQWVVVVGIALNHYLDKSVRDGVQALWLGKSNGVHHLPCGDTIRIDKVMVVPETFASIAELMSDPERAEIWKQSKAMVLDFGGFTTGWVPLVNGVPDASSDSIDVGVSLLVERLTHKLREATGIPSLTEVDAEMAMIGQKQVFGRVIDGKRAKLDVATYTAQSAAEVWPQIEAQLRSRLHDLRGMDVVAIGGGAMAFKAQITASFKDANLCIPSTAQTLNSSGMLRLARSALNATTA
jgi:hypothetical protein